VLRPKQRLLRQKLICLNFLKSKQLFADWPRSSKTNVCPWLSFGDLICATPFLSTCVNVLPAPESLTRRAKYGLINTDRGDSMIFHLGMSGRWRINPHADEKHDHLLLKTASGNRLALNDPRRFGFVDLHDSDDLASYPPFVNMGPEPLSDEFDGQHLAMQFGGRASPVKALLLDQKNVAGLGNIYVCEALNIAGISPQRKGSTIARKRLDRLALAIKQILVEAIEAGGSTLRDFAQPDGELGYFSKQWRVYGREGEDCTCGKPIKRMIQSGRSTFYCSNCQR